jgi:site-specific recombinase XerD
MSTKGIIIYSPDVGKRYIEECISCDVISHEYREKIRSVQVLDDYLNLGYIRNRTVIPVKHALKGNIGEEMQKLIAHLINLRRNTTTIKSYELYLSYFLKYLTNEAHVSDVNEISEYHILHFISTRENNKISIVSSLRVLFRYWFENHITNTNREPLLGNYKWVKKERIPSFYTPEEVMKIESSVDRSSATGLRNYAMLLLSSRLGLRASDIAALKFSDISWTKNEIGITQCKTREPVILPLLADVGNAIIDYLKQGRFNSNSRHVFLSARAPYVEATRQMVCSALSEIISNAGISIKYRHHGPHSMRHSLASALLQNGTSLPVISDVLGHKAMTSTMTYLTIDIASLLKCALPVTPVDELFYMQKGGAFYE